MCTPASSYCPKLTPYALPPPPGTWRGLTVAVKVLLVNDAAAGREAQRRHRALLEAALASSLHVRGVGGVRLIGLAMVYVSVSLSFRPAAAGIVRELTLANCIVLLCPVRVPAAAPQRGGVLLVPRAAAGGCGAAGAAGAAGAGCTPGRSGRGAAARSSGGGVQAGAGLQQYSVPYVKR